MAAFVFTVESLSLVGRNDILAYKNEDGLSVLSEAAKEGYLECCEYLCDNFPELLLITDVNGSTAMHVAASRGNYKIVNLLISQANGSELLMTPNKFQYTALHHAAEAGQLRSVEELLAGDNENNNLLTKTNDSGNTALHLAVRKQHLEVVRMLVEKDRNYAYPCNAYGHTPLFIAWEADLPTFGNNQVAIRELLVERHCAKDKDPNNQTLLHRAAKIGNIVAVDTIIRLSPTCLPLVDINNQNFLHVAASGTASGKQGQLINHIVNSDKIPVVVWNQEDINGKTPLHIAISTGNEGVILPLLYSSKVNKKIVDQHGIPAIASLNFYYDKIKAGVYNNKDLMTEKELSDQSTFDLLVAALICTVSFTSGVMVPGGFSGEGASEGNAILYKKDSFLVFVASNSVAFALALYAVFSHFCIKHLGTKEDIIFQLRQATMCIFGSIFALMASFIAGSFAVFGVHHKPAFIACVACFICFFMLSVHPIWLVILELRKKRAACMLKGGVDNGATQGSPSVDTEPGSVQSPN